MERARDELLAGAGLAGDQHRRIARCDLVRQRERLAERAAHRIRRLGGHAGTHVRDLIAQRHERECSGDHELERRRHHRLGQEVVDAGTHRINGNADVATPREHDRQRLGILLAQREAQLDARHPGHHHVDERDFRRRLLHRCEARLGGGHVIGGVAAAPQCKRDELRFACLVIDDENSRSSFCRTLTNIHGASVADPVRVAV